MVHQFSVVTDWILGLADGTLQEAFIHQVAVRRGRQAGSGELGQGRVRFARALIRLLSLT